MESIMSLIEHVDITVGNDLKMLGFVSECPVCSGTLIRLSHFISRLCPQSWNTQVVCGRLFMTCM
jgi:hypothetical protein